MVRIAGKKKDVVAGAEDTGSPKAVVSRGKDAWKKWTAADVLAKLDYALEQVPGETKEEKDALLLSYIEYNLKGIKHDAPSHRLSGGTPEGYIVGIIENSIADGHLKDLAPPQASEVESSEAEDEDTQDDGGEQEIIEVSQEQVKKALKVLLMRKNDVLAMLYNKFDEYNKQYFNGALSTPLITVDQLNNRTLANYTHAGHDRTGLDNHIRFNQNFIALNEDTRILETLRHEMVHQWQDEVLYAATGSTNLKKVKLAQKNAEGEIEWVESFQKKRPREWHNNDFRGKAAMCDFPANGAKCTGNPANMPEPKSYNRKFLCGCVASNGYPLTIYSTRPIDATCNACGNKFEEVEKAVFKGGTIDVTTSHVEKENEDAIHNQMLVKFNHFERFDTKGKKDAFVEELQAGNDENPMTDMQEGVYQKNHNAYKWGYRYWVAYNNTEVSQEAPTPDEIKQAVKDKAKRGKPKAAEAPKVDKPASEDGKKGRAKILKFPNGAPDVPAAPERKYDGHNPQDILDLYIELNGTRKVAAKLGIVQSTLISRAKKMGIDFNTKTINKPE